jgi:hypothetical protein
MDEENYAEYVDKKLHERIELLPTFGELSPGQKPRAPRIKKKLVPITVQDGGIVEFEVIVDGTPSPTVTWFRQTQIIKSSRDFEVNCRNSISLK